MRFDGVHVLVSIKCSKKVVVKNKKTNSSINDTSSSEDDSSFSNVEIENAYPLLRIDKFNIGNYVIVIYENDYFPGVIKTCKNSEYEVSTLFFVIYISSLIYNIINS